MKFNKDKRGVQIRKLKLTRTPYDDGEGGFSSPRDDKISRFS